MQSLWDLLEYNEITTEWRRVNILGDQPAHRHGHIMVCYYDYIFVFGGRGTEDRIFDDLWIFDIIKEDWHMIADASRPHELMHDGV